MPPGGEIIDQGLRDEMGMCVDDHSCVIRFHPSTIDCARRRRSLSPRRAGRGSANAVPCACGRMLGVGRRLGNRQDGKCCEPEVRSEVAANACGPRNRDTRACPHESWGRRCGRVGCPPCPGKRRESGHRGTSASGQAEITMSALKQRGADGDVADWAAISRAYGSSSNRMAFSGAAAGPSSPAPTVSPRR